MISVQIFLIILIIAFLVVRTTTKSLPKHEIDEKQKIAEKLSKSEVFQALRFKIFESEKPNTISWHEHSDILVTYSNVKSLFIPKEEVPDCLEFMRALAHLYKNEYSYSEHDYSYDGNGWSARLQKNEETNQKPTW